ncbi:MAG TPA: hypothetical protein VGL99_34270 [Chloroflexota bacterium]|jgi:hypothetical protein
MPEAVPDDPAWLRELVARSPLLPDPALRKHWQRLIPWLPKPQRYELAATLLEAEQRLNAP